MTQITKLKRRVDQLTRHRSPQKIVIVGALFGPDAWKDARGFGLHFLDESTKTPWTDREKAAVLADHLGISHREALRRVAEEDSR